MRKDGSGEEEGSGGLGRVCTVTSAQCDAQPRVLQGGPVGDNLAPMAGKYREASISIAHIKGQREKKGDSICWRCCNARRLLTPKPVW